MNTGLSFAAGLALGSADLLGLWLFTRSIGRKTGSMQQAMLFTFLITKIGLLGGGIWLIQSQPWFHAIGLVIGLSLPFAAVAFRAAFKKDHAPHASL